MDDQRVDQIEEEAERIATKDTLALVGFVISLVGFLSGLNAPVAWPFDITGIVLSIIGIKSKHWGGFAIAGIVLGGLGIIGSTALALIFSALKGEGQ